MRKLQNKQNSMFGIILFCAILYILLDLAGVYMIDAVNRIPVWLNTLVNTAFFMIQTAFPAIMFLYVVILSCHEISAGIRGLMLPNLIVEILLLVNPFTGIMFSFRETASGLTYVHGGAFFIQYVNTLLYVGITAVYVMKYARFFRKIEIRTILSFMAIISATMFLQLFFPRILLNGVAVSIAIFLMFLSMQNPEVMLDTVTGTFNYSALTDFLRRQISERKELWITVVDVGGIRRINSSMGIRMGNELLESVGNYINGICKNHAKAFRVMGTRLIIVSETRKIHMELVRKVGDRFRQPWDDGGAGIMLMATIRYCEHKNVFSSPDDIVQLIDLAYAKTAQEGFGTTRPVDTEFLEQHRRNRQIREAIRRALMTGEGFSLRYQPIYAVSEKRFCGAEALLRFTDPILGSVSPAEFIPIAENTGLISQIDKMVVAMACNFLRTHPELFDAGFRLMEINLSAAEFRMDTAQVLSDITTEIQSMESRICFEVTETALMTRPEVLDHFMRQLIDRGVRFAIDDFGTGYANIIQLAKLPFSIVKLDRTFVTQNTGKEAIVLRNMIRMFKNIGLPIVFEGVETPEQAEYAASLGVEQIQGFYYSKPLTEDEILRCFLGSTESESASEPAI